MLDLDAREVAAARSRCVVDLRNIYDPVAMRDAGFPYVCVGR